MNPLLEQILMTEWLYIAVLVWLSTVSFGVGFVAGFLWGVIL